MSIYLNDCTLDKKTEFTKLGYYKRHSKLFLLHEIEFLFCSY